MASVVMVATATGALAAPPHDSCPAGPAGGGSSTIGGWERMDLATLTAAIIAAGGDAAIAEAEFAARNKNGDQFVCTMTQILPNDASGGLIWFVTVDNTARAR